MSEQRTTITYKEPISVSLTRGMKGQYSWALEVHVDLPNKALQKMNPAMTTRKNQASYLVATLTRLTKEARPRLNSEPVSKYSYKW